MEHARSHWNANAYRDILEFFVKVPYVPQIVIKPEVIAVGLVNADAKWDGRVRIARSVIRTLDARTATVAVHGNATASQDGVECYAMKH